MKDLKGKFGERLRQIRQEKGLTQEGLAEATRLSVDFVSLVERGINAPSFKSIEKLARALDVEVVQLFVFDDLNSEEKK
jgi:transcriptional regulator with XRE-family HTH domain